MALRPAMRRCSLAIYANSAAAAAAAAAKSMSTAAAFEFSGKSAYEVLGVSESCSATEIKSSFHKLAKETHPDVVAACSGPTASSRQFLQILAAYEILSDAQRRAHYDSLLFCRRKILQKQDDIHIAMYKYNSCLTLEKQTEVVEWMEWYRHAVNDIVTQRKVASGSGYFYEIESELYSAIRAAYYGPLIESMDFLPDCFEAEERSASETSEVLHLVSGRDCFGIVQIANEVPKLSHQCSQKLTPFSSTISCISEFVKQRMTGSTSSSSERIDSHSLKGRHDYDSDVYKDLELHISGRLVATATRTPPRHKYNNTNSEDRICVFLENGDEEAPYPVAPDTLSSNLFHRNLLGTIVGLRTSAEEGSCSVYDKNGSKTHVIMKHRTFMVKHLHWYRLGDEVSTCECRCTRARLPPSRFWLFEPRCSMHDIGGWYIETYGRDKKNKTALSQRRWDAVVEPSEKRLHPAMYLLALAYRTLDVEDAKRRRVTIKDWIGPKLDSILRYCKNHW